MNEQLVNLFQFDKSNKTFLIDSCCLFPMGIFNIIENSHHKFLGMLESIGVAFDSWIMDGL